MKPFIVIILLTAVQKIVDTSFSDNKQSEFMSGDENEETLSRDFTREFCGENNEQCKVSNRPDILQIFMRVKVTASNICDRESLRNHLARSAIFHNSSRYRHPHARVFSCTNIPTLPN